MGAEIVLQNFRECQQLYLFEDWNKSPKLDSSLWHGSFNGRESSLQQLSPYVGKFKTGMAKVLIELYSKPGDIVLDPFAGSGVIPLEAALAQRQAWANDLSPYAYTVTRGKLESPVSEIVAIQQASRVLKMVEQQAASVDLTSVPEWVSSFFHPETLRETLAAFQLLKQEENYFLTACLLGILHHVRPGFLSYPASHLVPYLRKNKYPPEQFPEMYAYRDLQSRLLAKVRRAYRRHLLPESWQERQHQVWQKNSMNLPIKDETVDAIISSPPYFGALDYARDNRLRLWFLGYENWKELDASLTSSSKVYLSQMAVCLKEMERILKPGCYCVLVLGDVQQEGQTKCTAEILASVASDVTNRKLTVETIYDDFIPDERRSRRKTCTTKFERILVMRKV
jgi:methylase of polypeptide subunit release factors